MTNPTFTVGDWLITYKRISQNCFFLISYHGKLICHIPRDIFEDDLQCLSFPLDLHGQIYGNEARFGRFMKRVSAYNEKLG